METANRRVHTNSIAWRLTLFALLLLGTAPSLATVPAPAVTTGVITTIAGSGAAGSTGDGGLAVSAGLHSPSDVAVDGAGNVYIADYYNHRIRKVTAATGVITTVAGGGACCALGDGGLATAAWLSYPSSVALDGSGNIYIADTYNHRIRKVTASTGLITTVAGSGTGGYAGDGGVATAAELYYPEGVAVDTGGNIYIADTSNHRIRKVTVATGLISLVAGSGANGFSGDGAAAFAAQMSYPARVAVDTTGNVYISDTSNNRIRMVTAATVVITTVAGTGSAGYSGEAGAATSARLYSPAGIAVDGARNLYIADFYNDRIRKVTAATGRITTVAGSGTNAYGGDGGAAPAAQLSYPIGVAVAANGSLYIADRSNNRIRQVTPPTVAALLMTTVAGTGGASGYTGDGGLATAARLYSPRDVAVDSAGNSYIADHYNHRIRKVTAATGVITTVAGGGACCALGDGGLATAAWLSYPSGVALDGSGNIYIADTYNHRIRKVTASTGLIATVAGSGAGGYSGDGGVATAAELYYPEGVAVDTGGNIYIADTWNHKIRKVTVATGLISLVAGSGANGFSGDGAAAFAAQMSYPARVAVDTTGNVYISDTSNNRIRMVTAATAVITTVAGTGTSGYTGEAGAATSARLSSPRGVVVDTAGNLYIADYYYDRIRKITVSTGLITTVAGSGTYAFGGDGGVASAAQLYGPMAVAVDANGNLYIADSGNSCIRLASVGCPTVTLLATTFPDGRVGVAYPSTTLTQTGGVGVATFAITGGALPSGMSLSSAGVVSGTPTAAGTFSATVTATDVNECTGSRAYTLTINPPATATMTVNPSSLTFAATKNGADGAITSVTGAQAVSVAFSAGSPSWAVSANQSWVSLSASGGTGTGTFTVSISDPSNVIAGSTSLSAMITVASVSASNSPRTIAVTLSVDQTNGATTAVAIGGFDSPSHNATGIVGAIAVTGWALDDIGVERVEIWRNCLTLIDSSRSGVCRTATPGGAPDRVFIGNAAFVPGARTDIETNPTYAGYPQAYRAGWGYLLLTNALPNQATGATEGGQGPITLYAYAIDREGRYTELGSKTVTLNNDNATVPFGAIDTPEQGGTVTAALSANFGWAMTRRQNAAGVDIPKCILRSRYRVYIDSVARTLVTDTNWFPNLVRSDLTAAYPGLCDSANSLAAYYIDVPALGLTNGTHTIGWDVYDDNGTTSTTADDNAAGIGSRFFNILVGGADAPVEDRLRDKPARRGAASDITALPATEDRQVRARVGFVDAPVVTVAADREGARRVNLPAGHRLVVDLGGPVSRGYLIVGDELRDLPIGATLDAEGGQFYWQPAVPFFGPFELVFVSDAEGAASRTTLHVTITDPTAGGDPAITITSPKAGANPNQVIMVTGTARDPQALSGPGIDAVHVWAYRRDVDGVPPQFLGVATLAGERYALTTAPLMPGTYDLAVFAWVARTGTWAPASVVNIAVR